jgi:hypothetical protein
LVSQVIMCWRRGRIANNLTQLTNNLTKFLIQISFIKAQTRAKNQ